MERLLGKIKQKHYVLVAFCLAGLTMFLFLSYAQVLSTGKYIVLEGDLFEIYVPYIKTFIHKLIGGENLWYSWNVSMGMNTSFILSFYWLNPFNLLFLLPFDETVITAILIILKTSLAAATFQLFVSKGLKCSGVESIVFSLFYALCGYQVVYNIINIIWMDALYMLPVICLLIIVYCEKKKWIPLVIGYAALFIMQFYMAYMVGIFSAFFFILWLYIGEKKERKEVVLCCLKYVGTVILAVTISAAIILPTALFLLQNNPEDATQFGSLSITFLEIYNNLFWGEMQGFDGIYPYIYCGIPTILLLPFFFCNKYITKKERVGFGVILGLLVICMMSDPFYRFLHAFDAPDSFGFRFSFLVSFVLAMIACKQSAFIEKLNCKYLLLVVIMNMLLYSIEQQIQGSTIGTLSGNSTTKLGINFAFMLIWIVIVWCIMKHKAKQLTIAVCVVALSIVECGTNAYACLYKNEDTKPQITQKSYEVWKDSVEQAVETIQQEDDSVYRMVYQNDFIHNSDSWFGYMGVSDFSTAENPVLRNTMSKLGFFTSPRLTFQYGITPVTEMLLGVRYRIDGVNPYVLSENIPNATYVRNEETLSFGYLVERNIEQFEFQDYDSFKNMDMLLSCMTGEDINCFDEIPSEDALLDTNNMEVIHSSGNTLIKKQTDTIPLAQATYRIPYDERPAYVQFEDNYNANSRKAPILIGGIENAVEVQGRLSSSYVKMMQIEEQNYTVTIEMNPVTDQEAIVGTPHFAYYNESELKKAYDILCTNQMEIVEFKDAFVKANISVPKEGGLLFTSIPYDEGWDVTANGSLVETSAVLDGAFLAIPLEGGDYELEFVYTAPGSRIGGYISLGALSVFVVICLIQRILRKKRNDLVK